jgi:serine/threonine protein kinase
LILQIFGDQLNEKHKNMILKNPAFKHIKINKIEDDLDRKFKSINADALDLLKKCLVMDPNERQDCKSLLTHRYFEDFTEIFEDEIQQLLELDSYEFRSNRLRKTSKERTDENNILTPRSPIFERVPVKVPVQVPVQVHKNKDKSDIKIKNENWDRKDGTPSFNKIKFKNIEPQPTNTNSNTNKNKVIGKVGHEVQKDNDEFNISFTNDNYNPINSNRVEDKLSSERVKFNSNDIMFNTNEYQEEEHSKMPNKLIHISENYNNDNKNFRVAVVDDKVNVFKVNKDATRKIIRQKFGSPAPVKGSKNRGSKIIEATASMPVFSHEITTSVFPDLPASNVNEHSVNDDMKLENNLKKKKRRRQKVMAPDVKIMDLQHNMMQLSN